MSQLQTNLENLQEILDSINNLPEANNSTKTATVTITTNSGLPSYAIYYAIDKNGELLSITTAGTYEVMNPSLIYLGSDLSGLYHPRVSSGDATNLNAGCYIFGDCTLNIEGEIT